MTGRRHSFEEIAAKMRQANELASTGSTQKNIADMLGVSVMTFHRWRKDQRQRQAVLKEQQLENVRLRRLVTDLLLEKLRLEEQLNKPQ